MNNYSINFFNEDISLRLNDKNKIRKWIADVVQSEGQAINNLNFIFCSDKYLKALNVNYLQHDDHTDVITFDLTDEEEVISGDIFISLERVKENAKKYKTTIRDELHRVMIHGVLHLIGYEDDTDRKKARIREYENNHLASRSWIPS